MPLNVTVNNTGNQPTGSLTVALSGPNAADFDAGAPDIGNLGIDGSAMFTVRPLDGLSAGTYTATVTVSGANITSRSFNLSFTVNPASGGATYTITTGQNQQLLDALDPIVGAQSGDTINITGNVTLTDSRTLAAGVIMTVQGGATLTLENFMFLAIYGDMTVHGIINGLNDTSYINLRPGGSLSASPSNSIYSLQGGFSGGPPDYWIFDGYDGYWWAANTLEWVYD
jgi:hypothetical protein